MPTTISATTTTTTTTTRTGAANTTATTTATASTTISYPTIHYQVQKPHIVLYTTQYCNTIHNALHHDTVIH
jgi:hypothetical protein